MTLWFLFALMTAMAVLAALWPLVRRNAKLRSGDDVAVYRDQLDEIQRDRAAGLIGEVESAAAQVEVSRRLLAAADADAAVPRGDTAPVWRRRLVAIVALVALPAGTVGLYLLVGSPSLPGQPLAARVAVAQNQSVDQLIAQVEQHLAANPDDVRGWQIIAPVYLRLGRFEDAVNARRTVLRLAGPSADRLSDLGEALVGAGSGVVTAEAKTAFEQAVALDADDVRARYFLGLAAEQDGRSADAAAAWRQMLAKNPDAPWASFVRGELARIEGGTVADNEPADNPLADPNLAPDQRMTMIRAMVARLSDRLHQDGSDPQGWLQLMRSYVVLGELEQARAAVADARRALAGDPDKLRQVDEASKGLGIEEGPAGNPTAGNPAAVSDEQMAMIRGMVGRLADRLHQDGSDSQGWLQLMRSYMVLGERDQARAAAADARHALAADPDKLRQVEELAKGLGIEN